MKSPFFDKNVRKTDFVHMEHHNTIDAKLILKDSHRYRTYYSSSSSSCVEKAFNNGGKLFDFMKWS